MRPSQQSLAAANMRTHLRREERAELRGAREHVLERLEQPLLRLGGVVEHRDDDSRVPLHEHLGLDALRILHEPHRHSLQRLPLPLLHTTQHCLVYALNGCR